MINKNKAFKNFLATTSMFGFITITSTNAMGAADIITMGNVGLSNFANWYGGVPAIDNDGIILGGAGHTINFNRPNAVISGINLAGKNGEFWKVSESVSIGSIGNGGNASPVNVSAGKILTLTGTQDVGRVLVANNYGGLGNITLGGAGSTLVVDCDADLTSTVSGKSGTGHVIINANKDVTFRNAINPGNPINRLSLSSNSKLEIHANMALANNNSAIELDNGSELTINGGRYIQGVAITEEINGVNPDYGTLIFTGGNSKLDSISIGTTNSIHELRIASAHKLESNQNVKATLVNFAANGTFDIEGFITGKVDNTTGGNDIGILTFSKVAGGVTGSIGTTNTLHEINFNTGGKAIGLNTRGGGVIKATTLNFLADDIVTAHSAITGNINFNGTNGKFESRNLITGDVDDAIGGGNGILTFITATGGVTGPIGKTNTLHEINIKNGAQAHLSDNLVKSKVINIGEVGGAGKLIRGGNVDLDINNGFHSNIRYIHPNSLLELRNTDALANHTITFYNILTGSGDACGELLLSSTGAGKNLIINNKAAETIGINPGNRIRELATRGGDNIVINPQVFSKQLILDGSGTVNFAGGVDLGNNGSITVNKNVTIEGNINTTGNNITINLNDKNLTYKNGNATLTGAITLNTTISPGVGIGHITVSGAASKLDLSGATAININLNGTSTVADIGKTYKLIVVNGGNFVEHPVNAVFNNNDRSARRWSYNNAEVSNSIEQPVAGGPIPIINPNAAPIPSIQQEVLRLNNLNTNSYVKFKITGNNIEMVDNISEGLKKDFGKTKPEIVEALENIDRKDDTDARNLVDEFGRMSGSNPERQEEAANRLTVVNPIPIVAQVINEAHHAMQGLIGTRIDNLSMITPMQISSESSGVSAGDAYDYKESPGIWLKLFYGQSIQSHKRSNPGFKTNWVGGTLGADYSLDEDLTLGAAISIVNSTINYKNKKLGDKTKVDTILLSLYGMRQLSQNWFIQGILSYGQSKVCNYEKRIINTSLTQVAKGKYNAITYGSEILVGYKYLIPKTNTMVTPLVGLRYGKFIDGGYKETGTFRRNLKVNKKTLDKLEGVVGGRLSFLTEFQNILLIPELYAFVSHDFKGKAQKVTAKLDGAMAPISTNITKREKTLINIGTSLTAKHNNMEYGIGYDAYLARKYIGHQGALKLRVNF